MRQVWWPRVSVIAHRQDHRYFQDIFKSSGETFRRIVHKDSHLQVRPFQCLYLCNIPIPGRSEERAKHSVMQFCLAQSHPLGLCSHEHRRYHPYGCACFLEAMAQFTLHLCIFTSKILTWKPRYDSRRHSVYLLIPLPSNSLPQSFDTRLSTSND